MRKKCFVFIVILLIAISSSFSQETKVLSYGKKITIHSDILNQDREIYIHLPNGYEDCVSSYPVVYVMDGENMFYPMSGLIELMSWQRLIPKMIVVGIPNIDRMNDFMPLIDTIPSSGGADKFVSFFNKELFPHMKENYRTESFSILYGHSRLGMFTVYCLKKHPTTFNAYIAGSPSLAYNYDYLCSGDFPVKKLNQNRFLYFTIGDLENKKSIENVNQLISLLKSSNPDKLIWNSSIVSNEDHDTNASLTFINGLNYIFSDWKKIKQVIYQGMDATENHFSKLSDTYNYTVKVPEDIYRLGGLYYIQNGAIDKGIEIFKKYIQNYSSSYKAYNYLGEALILKKDIEKAKESFQKALELKPNFKEAKDNLEKIKQ